MEFDPEFAIARKGEGGSTPQGNANSAHVLEKCSIFKEGASKRGSIASRKRNYVKARFTCAQVPFTWGDVKRKCVLTCGDFKRGVLI